MVSNDHSTDSQSGSALITALVIVALMGIAAVAILDTMRFSYRVAVNTAQRDQARLYLLGAERLAGATLSAARKAVRADSYPVLDEWTREPILFPIDGGQISGRIVDGANCFNVNAVVREDVAGYVRDDADAGRFELMLEELGIGAPQSTELTNALVDWIDADAVPGYGGAEDPFYASLEQPYRTGGTFLADISELKAISGFTPEVFEQIEPFICAYPDPERQPLNVNTLTERQAPLLISYLGKEFDRQAVIELLAERPISGFKTIEDFQALPLIAGEAFKESQKDDFALKSEYYTLKADILHYETAIALTSTLSVSDTGEVKNVSRRYGAN